MRALRSWVGLWDVREHPRSLALVRILMAAVLLWDFAQVLQLDLVVPLFGPLEAGGLGNPLGRKQPPLLYELLPATAGVAQGTVLAVVGLSATLMVGLLPRLSAALLVVLLAQLALVLPPADRGIDMLVRNTLVVLAFSRCGDTLSLGPRLQTGSWPGSIPHGSIRSTCSPSSGRSPPGCGSGARRSCSWPIGTATRPIDRAACAPGSTA
jgi:hypothetical protein